MPVEDDKPKTLYCPTCGSDRKSDRRLIETFYGVRQWCSDNWHWSDTVSAAPQGWAWNADDDRFMWLLDLAFQKPLFQIMEEWHFLKIDF